MKLESTLRENAGLLYTAPLLNVVLLLLVFFLLSSNLVLKSGFPVSVPASSSSLPPIEASHIITVLPGAPAQIYFNQHKVKMENPGAGLSLTGGVTSTSDVNLGDLPLYLENNESKKIRYVIIRGDRFAPFGLVVEISNLVKEHGYDLAYATTNDR